MKHKILTNGYFLAIISGLFFTSIVPFSQNSGSNNPEMPHNIILMIGDGMGLSQISALIYSNNNYSTLEKFPVTGLQKTHSATNLITDSAASGTAMACGVKTSNGMLGLNADSVRVQSIMEEAKTWNIATGLIVTSSIVHATPAAFYSHEPIRVNYENIALWLTDHQPDLAIGGGKRFFHNRESDNKNLIKRLKNKGYTISAYSKLMVEKLSATAEKPAILFTDNNQPVSRIDGRNYLPNATKHGLQFLNNRNKNGFFAMIEGSQIDWACHAKDAAWAIAELKDFEKAIHEAYEFARKDGNTLLIVTADHATGGMALNPRSKLNKLKLAFTTNGHNPDLIPVFAYGPGSQLFSGIYDNTEVHHKLKKLLSPKSSLVN